MSTLVVNWQVLDTVAVDHFVLQKFSQVKLDCKY